MILIVFGITLIIASKQEELKGLTKEKNSLFNPRRHKICFRDKTKNIEDNIKQKKVNCQLRIKNQAFCFSNN